MYEEERALLTHSRTLTHEMITQQTSATDETVITIIKELHQLGFIKEQPGKDIYYTI